MGASFLLASFVGFNLLGGISFQLKGIILSSFIMLIFGVIDDLRELSILAKFTAQIIATGILIFFGVKTQIMSIGALSNIIITFIWIIGITNALNHLDVMDGLAAGIALIVNFSFLAIMSLNGEINLLILPLALGGAIASFFIFNLIPKKIYMGNSGSHFLGFVLAVIALVISYAPLERKIALFSPLLILGFPILDTGFLILVRAYKKKIPFKKSNDHLALRFLALGYSKKKSLAVMLAWSLFFSISGVIISQVSNSLGLIIIVCVGVAGLILTIKMSKVAIDG